MKLVLGLALSSVTLLSVAANPNAISVYQDNAWSAPQSYGFATIQNIATNANNTWVQGSVTGKTGSYIAYGNGTQISAPMLPVGMTTVLGIASKYPGIEHAGNTNLASEVWLLGSNADGQAMVASCAGDQCNDATTYTNLIASETKIYASQGSAWVLGKTSQKSCQFQYAAIQNDMGGSKTASCLAQGLTKVGFAGAIAGNLFVPIQYANLTKILYIRGNGGISEPVIVPQGGYTMLANYLNGNTQQASVMALGYDLASRVVVGGVWQTADGGQMFRQQVTAPKTFANGTTLILPHNGMYAFTDGTTLSQFDTKLSTPKWASMASPQLDAFSFEDSSGSAIYSIDPTGKFPSQVCDITGTSASCTPIDKTPFCESSQVPQTLMSDGKIALLCHNPGYVAVYDPAAKTWSSQALNVDSDEAQFSQSANLTNAWVGINVDGQTWVSSTK